MLDRNKDGKINIDDLRIFIEEVDGFADSFITHEPTAKAIDKVKALIMPMIDLLDDVTGDGFDTIKEIIADWKTFVEMLDDGENVFTVAAQFKKTIEETKENVEEIGELINEAQEHVDTAKSFIEKFREEAPKAIAEFKADTQAINEDKADEFEAMRKHWAEGDKGESVKIFFKDGSEYVFKQTVEFFDLLGDLMKAGADSLTHAEAETDVVDTTVELVEVVDTTTVDEA